MSGTSADGVDAALVRIRLRPLTIRLKAFRTYPYPRALHNRIMRAAEGHSHLPGDLAQLNQDVGVSFATAVHKVCRQAKIPTSRLSWIGSHGQTIFHSKRATLQIGEPAVIANATGVTTVADFRQADIAVGGLGAPLTPYFNYHYFRHLRGPIIFQNIGGIANLTYIPAKKSIERVRAFDTGPGNMVIDAVIRQLSRDRVPYDHAGRRAARGTVHRALLRQLMAGRFISKAPPKTFGREQFGPAYVARVLAAAKRLRLSSSDTMATVTALTAQSIAKNCRRFIYPQGIPTAMIVGGGGAHNATLLQLIQDELPELKVVTAEQHGLSIDAAEAIAFAFLAGETLAGRPANLPQVTGAKKKVVLGKIIYKTI